jgi:6-phosphogluconolactonase
LPCIPSLNSPPEWVFDHVMNVPKAVMTALVSALGSAVPGLSAVPGEARAAEAGSYLVYIGTYTGPKSQGIYVCRLDPATGTLTTPQLAAETPNPTFLAVNPRPEAASPSAPTVLFAANEVGGGGKGGTVTGYAVDKASGRLTPLNQQSSRGGGPCHLSVDRTGSRVLVANYGSGSIAVLPVSADGRLGEATAFIQHTGSSVNPQRQEGPHAHWIDVAPDNRFAFACDLGLDKIMVYDFNRDAGSLVPHEPPSTSIQPGSGPRHLAFHPSGRFAYLINEMSNTVTGFTYDAGKGALKEFQTLTTLPKDFDGQSSTAEIEVHPSGRFLYGSNRGHDSIAVYAINPRNGRFGLLENHPTLGKTPRNFAVDPTGRWLLAANQGSDSVVVFGIDPKTGRLKPTGQTVSVGAPVCIRFVPSL